MARVWLPISKNYVPTWGVREGLREILQNWADARDRRLTSEDRLPYFGGDHKGASALKCRNEGVFVTRDKLVLGGTDKADRSDQRGHFGEGMKLGWLALLRKGATVRCVNGPEIWAVSLAYSDEFKVETLAVDITARPGGDAGHFEVQIGNLQDSMWEPIKALCLFLVPPTPSETIETDRGTILLEPAHKGKLYVRDIFVCLFPDDTAYGYNLRHVTLDRDRMLANPYDLRYEIRGVLTQAVEQGKIAPKQMLAILENAPSSTEAHVFSSVYESSPLVKAVAEAFTEKYGAGTLPATSIGESARAAQHGVKTITVPQGLAQVLSVEFGRLDTRLKDRALDVSETHNFSDLSPDEQTTLLWLGRAFAPVAAQPGDAMDVLNRVTIVSFYGDKILGRHKGHDISLARSTLSDPPTAAATLLHELAHDHGDDGDASHRDAIETYAGRLLAHFVK